MNNRSEILKCHKYQAMFTLTEILALSYVVGLGGKRDFASEILCLLVLSFWGCFLEVVL